MNAKFYLLSFYIFDTTVNILNILQVVNYIHWFSYIKPLLHFWVKLSDQEIFIFFFIHF